MLLLTNDKEFIMSINITVTLSPEQVSEAITQYLRTQGFNTQEVSYTIKTVSHGYGRGEYDEQVFSGASVAVTPVKQNTGYSSLAAQIAAVENDPRQYGDH